MGMTPYEPPRSGAVILYLALAFALIAGSLVLALFIASTTEAASRSAPESSPAPTRTGVPQRAAGHDADVVASGTPPTPAPANVAGSEGPPGLTTPMPAASRTGIISHMGSYPVPRTYLALPCKRGNVHCGLTVRLCGPADCVTLRQTDYGPSQRIHPDRIADVHPAMFERICGVPASYGLCNGSWTSVVRPTLPPTDMEE